MGKSEDKVLAVALARVLIIKNHVAMSYEALIDLIGEVFARRVVVESVMLYDYDGSQMKTCTVGEWAGLHVKVIK